MIRVYISKQSNYPVNSPSLKRRLREFLHKEGIVSDADVSVSLVGEKKMRNLTKKYLGESMLHNVLSFPFIEDKGDFRHPPEDVIHLGDIVICYPKLVEEARKEEKLIDEKTLELAEHGALHLLGKHHDV